MKKLDKKQIIKIITVALAVILFCGWFWLAFVHLNSAPKNAGRYDDKVGTKIIADGGYSAKYLKNTNSAFYYAINESFFQGIKTSVYKTKDGEYVCSDTDTPFLDKGIKISASNFSDLKSLPMDLSGESDSVDKTITYTICKLSEYLNICKRKPKKAIVEIPQQFNREETEELCSYVLERISSANLAFLCRDKKTVDYVYDKYYYAEALLFSSKSRTSLFTALGYNIAVDDINEKLVKRCHDKEVLIATGFVADKNTYDKMINYGVDYIFCGTVF